MQGQQRHRQRNIESYSIYYELYVKNFISIICNNNIEFQVRLNGRQKLDGFDLIINNFLAIYISYYIVIKSLCIIWI